MDKEVLKKNIEELNVYILFVWIILYGYANSMTNGKSREVAICIMGAYGIGFVFWIYFSKQNQKISLNKMPVQPFEEYVYLIPILFLPIYNFLCIRECNMNWSVVVLALNVSIIEELFFRGFLLHYCMKRNRMKGVFVSALIFGVFHCVNLIQNREWKYVLFQSIGAIIVGIYYNEIVLKYNSLFPCIIAHFLINVTGMQGELQVDNSAVVIGYGICMMFYLTSEIFLYRKIKK